MEEIKMWEINVPASTGDDRFSFEHHQEWDKKVRTISGGLTVYKGAKGQWLHPETNELYQDRMIPVRIACTHPEIREIMRITLEHYEQEAVLAYLVSEQVLTLSKEECQKQRKAHAYEMTEDETNKLLARLGRNAL